jgi:hypothetical protein
LQPSEEADSPVASIDERRSADRKAVPLGDKSPKNNSKVKKQKANKRTPVIQAQAPPSAVKPRAG